MKRSFSFLLSVVMLITALSVPAFAFADSSNEYRIEVSSSDGAQPEAVIGEYVNDYYINEDGTNDYWFSYSGDYSGW